MTIKTRVALFNAENISYLAESMKLSDVLKPQAALFYRMD